MDTELKELNSIPSVDLRSLMKKADDLCHCRVVFNVKNMSYKLNPDIGPFGLGAFKHG